MPEASQEQADEGRGEQETQREKVLWGWGALPLLIGPHALTNGW